MDNGKMAGAVIGIFVTLAMFAISIVLFLLGHFYIVNGLIVGFLPFLMMTSAGYSEAVCWGVYGLIVLVSVVLQLNFKVARVVFGIISCGVVSLFIWDKYKEMIWQKQLIYIVIGIVVTGLLNAVAYCREE
ncbi:MAG: hypothetical protein K6D38_06360 [Pseudobutyrivibrio sp.]|nr:hypothetical protein [Pseudobutyrivibrio sp.]